MRSLLLTLLLTSPMWAEPPVFVPSYNFQGPAPRPKTPPPQTHLPSAAQGAQGAQSAIPAQRTGPAPAALTSWTGTVIQAELRGLVTIASNAPIPLDSVLEVLELGNTTGNVRRGEASVVRSDACLVVMNLGGQLVLSPGERVRLRLLPGRHPVPVNVDSRAEYTPPSNPINAPPWPDP